MSKTQILGLQGVLSAALAAATANYGILFYMLVIFMVVMVIDFISGMMASKKESWEHPEDGSYGWSSKKGAIGIVKKFGYMLVVTVAVILDCVIYKVGGIIGFTMPSMTFFGILATVWYILNELLSIVENAGRMGVEGIPEFLTKTIKTLKQETEKKGNCTGATKEESE